VCWFRIEIGEREEGGKGEKKRNGTEQKKKKKQDVPDELYDA
jgi:hypothetical protein